MPNQTGPRTDEGKSASSQNNRQHGLSTANIIVSPDERPFFDQMEAALRDEIQPDGPLEDFAFRRLTTATWQMEKCQQKEAALLALDPSPETDASREKIQRYYQRWEGSYNSAFRQLRLLQTDRGLIAYNNGTPPKTLGPLADLPKIEHFARRIAKPFTLDDHIRKQLSNQLAILTLEEQILKQGSVPVSGHTYVKTAHAAAAAQAKSTTCETKSAPQPEVGRNSPCPCGSNRKFKRCCGVNAPPILHPKAA